MNWYHQALTVFAKVGGWIAGPIIIALFLGDWLDQRYDTTNRYLLICVAIAFIISNVGLITEVVRYSKQLKKLEQDIQNERNPE